MARDDDEVAVDAALRYASPPAVAPSVDRPAAKAPGPGFEARSSSGDQQSLGQVGETDLSGPPREPSEASLVDDTPWPATYTPGEPEPESETALLGLDLESQRRARAERLRDAEEAQEILASRSAEGTTEEVEEVNVAEVMPAGDRLSDGLGDGLRIRRRPEVGADEGMGSSTAHNVKPPDTFAATLTSALDREADEAPAVSEQAENPRTTALKKEGRDGRPQSGTSTPSGDERQCRICFGGWEDEGELGRLISPCLCAGSMRYVHVKCINQWRGTGANAKSFMECPQCHHQYSIRRTAVSGLATSKPILYMFTTLLFLQITFICGHVLLRYLVAAAEVAAEADKATKAAAADTTVGGMTRHGDVWESEDGSVIIAAPGLTLVYDIVVEAVDIFLDLAAQAYDAWPRDSRGFHTRISRMLLSTTIRLILGLSVLGSLSFLSLLASLSLFAPLQLAYTLWGTGLFRGPLENLRRRAGKAGGVLVIAAVVIGIANSLVGVYDLVHAVSRKLLAFVETQILEVNPEEARLAREAAERQPHWFNTWITERRWRRLAGWYEVMLRLWEWAKEVGRASVAWVKASVEARVHAAEQGRAGVGAPAAEPVRVG